MLHDPFAQASFGSFDGALRFCRAGDLLTVLHVRTKSDSEEERTQRYWEAEAAKVETSREGTVRVAVQCLPLKKQNVVETVLDGCSAADAHVVVLGSLELVSQMKGKMALGSVAEAVSKRCGARSAPRSAHHCSSECPSGAVAPTT